MFGMEKMFGGSTSEGSGQERDMHTDRNRFGRTAEDVIDDIDETVHREESREEKIDRFADAIRQISIDISVPAEDMLGRDELFTDKLVDMRIITRDAAGFEGTASMIKEAIRKAAAKRMNERAEHVNKYGNKQGGFQG